MRRSSLGCSVKLGALTLSFEQKLYFFFLAVAMLPLALPVIVAGVRTANTALDALRDPRFDALLSGSSSFEELPATMARLAAGAPDVLCHVVHYD